MGVVLGDEQTSVPVLNVLGDPAVIRGDDRTPAGAGFEIDQEQALGIAVRGSATRGDHNRRAAHHLADLLATMRSGSNPTRIAISRKHFESTITASTTLATSV